jgi:hypothetical protein
MEIHTIGALERLKHLDQLRRPKDVRVLGGDLHNNGKVLLLVDTKHFLQTCHGVLDSQLVEEVDKPVRVEQSCVYNHTLNVREVFIEF